MAMEKINITPDDTLRAITYEAKLRRLYESVKHVDTTTYDSVKVFTYDGCSIPNIMDVPELVSINETIIARISCKRRQTEDAAFCKAVQEYARENGRTELLLIPEETLNKILKLGTIELIKEAGRL